MSCHREYFVIKAIIHVCSQVKDTKTGAGLAVKKIPDVFRDKVDALRIVREIKLMKHFEGHENLISLYYMECPKASDFNQIYMYTALMETDLHRIIHSKQALSDDHVQYFVYQVLRGLKYMHSANVIHRDLKPSNILVNSNCDLKVCDFGLARGVDDDLDMTAYVVTRWYRAPEIMLDCKYDVAADVWSVGCIMGELLRRKVLFAGRNYMDQLELIFKKLGAPKPDDYEFVTNPRAREFIKRHSHYPKQPFEKIFPGASPLALDLLDRMLSFNPAKRISVDEALAHPYLASLHSPDDEPVCKETFDFSFEKGMDSDDAMRMEILKEASSYHPKGARAVADKLAGEMKGKTGGGGS